MHAENAPSKKLLWIGWILSAVPGLMLLSGGVFALMQSPAVIEGTRQAGYTPAILVPLGIIEIVCILLFLIPRTAFFGAVLLTAYFGGAVASHVRLGQNQWIVPVIFGIIVWVALACRDTRFRSFIKHSA
jgi:hypothetical protein